MIQQLNNINKYCLFILVFSVTFENWDPFKLIGTISVTYMASIFYIITWIPLLKIKFRLLPLKEYVVPLVLFIIMGVLSTALNSGYAQGFEDLYNERMVLLVILMFLIANHFYNDYLLVSIVLKIYVASILLMYVLYLLGIGVEFENGRLVLFGENPNSVGVKAVIAFLIVLSEVLNKYSFKRLVIGVFILLPLLNLVILSASRGALLSVFLGVAVLVITLKINMVKKLMLGIIAVGFSIFFFNLVMRTNLVFRNRIMRTIESGDTGRNQLWDSAFQIIGDNLFIGVGLPGALPVMFQYSGRRMDPHNVFLYVLMTTGIIGFIFFMLFLFRLGKNLFETFKYTKSALFMVVFIVLLFNMFKAGGGINNIFFWFFFAILIGATFYKLKEPT